MNISIRRASSTSPKPTPKAYAMASVLVSVRLFDNTLGGALADTATFKYDIKKSETGGEYSFQTPLSARDGSAYTAEIKIIDLIRQRTQQLFVDFERTGRYSGLNYKVRDHFSNREVYSRAVRATSMSTFSAPSLQPDTLWIFYYKPVKAIPPSPQQFFPR
jgi:hypothetical protein